MHQSADVAHLHPQAVGDVGDANETILLRRLRLPGGHIRDPLLSLLISHDLLSTPRGPFRDMTILRRSMPLYSVTRNGTGQHQAHEAWARRQ